MRMYSTKLRIILPIEVEAESMDEAIRIIDGVIDNVGCVSVQELYEGSIEEISDELQGQPERIERDGIELVDEGPFQEPALNEEYKLSRQEAFIQRSVDDLELSVRCVNCLRNAEGYGYPAINTVADLVKYSERDLMRIPNLGKRTVRDISELLGDYGLKLSKER